MNVVSRHATALLLCGACLAAMVPVTAAQAQTAAAASPPAASSASADQVNTGGAGTTVQEIVVTGTRASLDRALTIKRSTIGVVDAISAESIGKFPDQNVAESLQHIPGVSIDRSGGEGQFVTVRGFGPEFNTVLLNNRLLATDSGGREFSFDILPSELITGAEVYKSATADQQDGGIGSTIILRTARPLDHPGFHGSISAATRFDSTTDKGTPVASAVISNTNAENTFGILASLNYDKRTSHFENVNTSGWISQPTINSDGTPWLDPSHLHGVTAGQDVGVYLPRTLNYTSEYNTRERIGGTLAVDWKVSDKLKIQIDGLYTQLKVQSTTNQVGWFTDPGDIMDATVNGNGTVTNFTRKASGDLKTDNILFYSPENAKTYQLGVNGRWTPLPGTTVEADLSYSRASNVTKTIFDVIGESNPGVNPVFTLNPGGIPTMSNILPTFDPNRAYLHCCNERGGGPTDSVWQMRIDAKQDLNWGVLSDIKFGFLGTDRKKDILSLLGPNPLGCFYCGYFAKVDPSAIQFHPVSPGSILGAPALTWLGYSHAQLVQFEGSPAALNQKGDPQAIAAYQAVYTADGNSTAPTYDPIGSGSVHEQTAAIYLQGEFKGELAGHTWNSVLGVRYVYTDEVASGNSVTITGITMNPGDQTASQATFTPPVPVEKGNRYGYVLPSGTVRFDWSRKFDMRAAVSRTLTRPTLSDLSVSQSFNFRPPAQSTITGGNPALKPYLAWNYDVAVDYYLGRTSYASLAGFYKKISNFVSTATLPQTVFGEQFLVTEPLNANTSTVYGFEATLQYTFENLLPAPFDGLGTSLNYTKVDSSTSFNPALTAQVFNIEGLSDSANAIAFYEKGPIQVRVAYNWRAPFLQYTFGPNGLPQNVDAYGQVDLQGTYKLTPNMSVFAQVVNLTDAHERSYSSYTERLIELDDTGRRVTVGLRATF